LNTRWRGKKIVPGMSLDEYRSKTNFTYTPGRPRRGDNKRNFVVQKHAASRLHYDFRLAINGVLVSWAIPRGPSMKPADKRLAVHTEDHPLAYADFEGVPEGQYGAGTVMVWDTGPYDPQDGIPERQLAQGKIDVQLHGTKLRAVVSRWSTREVVRLVPKTRSAGCSSNTATPTPIRHGISKTPATIVQSSPGVQ
jgi:DNA ligase D-like protein (predicted 3'-phosphoesterase)